MHELSIAQSVVEVAAEAVRNAGATRAVAVRVRVGALSGVVPEALAFCYELAAQETVLEGSRLVVEVVPVVLHCPACDRDVTPADVWCLACPACGTPTADVRAGRELEVRSVEVT